MLCEFSIECYVPIELYNELCLNKYRYKGLFKNIISKGCGSVHIPFLNPPSVDETELAVAASLLFIPQQNYARGELHDCVTGAMMSQIFVLGKNKSR